MYGVPFGRRPTLIEFGQGLVQNAILADRARNSHDPLALAAAFRRHLSVARDWSHNDANPLSDGDQSYLEGSIPGAPGNVVLAVWCDGWELNLLLNEAVPLSI